MRVLPRLSPRHPAVRLLLALLASPGLALSGLALSGLALSGLALSGLALSGLTLSGLTGPAWAAAPLASPAQLCEGAIVAAGRDANLPAGMMDAIAVVETGRPDAATGALRPWPWTINAEGQGFFFASKQQAVEAVRALQARGVRSIDVGCMQINLMFHPDAFSTLEQAFDPGANARFAARFLNVLYAAHRDWLATIAAYHSETPALGAGYRRLVLAHWDRLPSNPWVARYADFTPRTDRYRDFLPDTQIYGAFAHAIDALPTAATLR